MMCNAVRPFAQIPPATMIFRQFLGTRTGSLVAGLDVRILVFCALGFGKSSIIDSSVNIIFSSWVIDCAVPLQYPLLLIMEQKLILSWMFFVDKRGQVWTLYATFPQSVDLIKRFTDVLEIDLLTSIYSSLLFSSLVTFLVDACHLSRQRSSIAAFTQGVSTGDSLVLGRSFVVVLPVKVYISGATPVIYECLLTKRMFFSNDVKQRSEDI